MNLLSVCQEHLCLVLICIYLCSHFGPPLPKYYRNVLGILQE